MTEEIYYVYEYLRTDGTPYYIGMGHANRMNELHKNVKTPEKKFRKIIQNNMTEKSALLLERELTVKYGLIRDGSGILENKIHGGHASPRGMMGKKHKEETRLKISLGNIGKVRSEEQKENYRKPKTKEHAENIRMAVLNNTDPDRYVYSKPFAHKGKPWTQARRDAHNMRNKR